MRVMRKGAIGIFLLLLWAGLSGCGRSEPELPEKIAIHFFYNEPCASCDGTKVFYQTVKEELGDVSDRYPYEIYPHNVFQASAAQDRDRVLGELGYDQEVINSLTYPIMTMNGKVYLGMDSISQSLREAYLTAGEDIFVYGRGVFDPTRKQTLKQLLESYKLEKGSSSIVYFYRTVCEECIRTEEVIDSLPETVTVDGDSYPQQIVRINTRSGRNNEVIQAFFAMYGVPEEEQMVPIVFTAQGYLAGYEAISSGLLRELEEGAGLGMRYPTEMGQAGP